MNTYIITKLGIAENHNAIVIAASELDAKRMCAKKWHTNADYLDAKKRKNPGIITEWTD